MARTACCEVCIAVYVHENLFSVSRAFAAQVTAPLSSGRAARSRRKSRLGYFLFGSVAPLPGNSVGHKQLGMERTTTNSLVPFEPFEPGRMKLRHTLSEICEYWLSQFTQKWCDFFPNGQPSKSISLFSVV